MKFWNTEKTYDHGRMIPIYEALKSLDLPADFSLVDVACGQGLIAEGLSWMWPDGKFSQFDYEDYPEWQFLHVHTYQMDVEDFMRSTEFYDVVLFLNSYRNWDQQEKFDEWLKGHARFFITSGIDGEVIGKDVKGYNLILKRI